MPFEKLKPDWNQTWIIAAIWQPPYVDEVKGHIPRSKVTSGQLLRYIDYSYVNVLMPIEKLTPDWKQTWIKAAIWQPSYVDEVKGHILRSKVIRGQVLRYIEC